MMTDNSNPGNFYLTFRIYLYVLFDRPMNFFLIYEFYKLL